METCIVPSNVLQPERASRSDCCVTVVTPPFPQMALVEGMGVEAGEGIVGITDEDEGGICADG